MIEIVQPKSYAHSIDQIDVEGLVEAGYRLLLCDIDNTLAAFDEAVPSAQAQAFIERCQKSGLEIWLCSNNFFGRVTRFAEAAGVPFVGFCCKPFRWRLKKALAGSPYSSTETVLAGDQICTDIIGANRLGFHSIFLDPLVKKDSLQTYPSRILEKGILTWLEKRQKWYKGEYYGFTL